jgi:hypothetical protein
VPQIRAKRPANGGLLRISRQSIWMLPPSIQPADRIDSRNGLMKACAIGVSSLGASLTSTPSRRGCICWATADSGPSTTALATPAKNSRRPGNIAVLTDQRSEAVSPGQSDQKLTRGCHLLSLWVSRVGRTSYKSERKRSCLPRRELFTSEPSNA